MCGIVGVLGSGPVAGSIVDALKRLEYRGYDSAGVATLENGRLERRRAEGKLKNLEAKLAAAPLSGSIGIGHTRWATHGKPTETNAHPHASRAARGRPQRHHREFQGAARGTRRQGLCVRDRDRFRDRRLSWSRTSSASGKRAGGGGSRGAQAHARRLRARLSVRGGGRSPDRRAPGRAARGRLRRRARCISARTRWRSRHSPIASPISRRATGSSRRARAPMFRDASGKSVAAARPAQPGRQPAGREGQLPPLHGQGNPRAAGSRRPYARPLRRYGGDAAASPSPGRSIRQTSRRISIVGCGTAYMAGLIGKYWIERFARLPVEIDVASEYRYREAPVERNGLTIVISQSGETADTLASLRYVKDNGSKTVGVVNVPDVEHRAAHRRRCADAGRSRDRRRLDQSLHLSARRDGLPGDQPRPRARRDRRGEGSRAARRTRR